MLFGNQFVCDPVIANQQANPDLFLRQIEAGERSSGQVVSMTECTDRLYKNETSNKINGKCRFPASHWFSKL